MCISVRFERVGMISLFSPRMVNVFGVVVGRFAGSGKVCGSRLGIAHSGDPREQRTAK